MRYVGKDAAAPTGEIVTVELDDDAAARSGSGKAVLDLLAEMASRDGKRLTGDYAVTRDPGRGVHVAHFAVRAS